MSAKKEIEKLLLEHFEPRLAKHGFKWLKSKRVFKRDCKEIRQEIGFHLHTYRPQEVRLKLELGSTVLAKFMNKKNYLFDTFSPNRIPDWDGFGVYNIDGTKECKVLQQLSRDLFNTGIPFLNSMSSVEELLQFYVTPAEILSRRNIVVELCLFLNSTEWADKVLSVWNEFKVSNYAKVNYHSLTKVDDEIQEALSVLLQKK